MILTTHAIVGAAAASLVPQNPLLAFAAGFVSHLVIDAIPHWEYVPDSMQRDDVNRLNTRVVVGEHFFEDAIQVLGDGFVGLGLSALIFGGWLFHISPLIIMLGAFGGLVPDMLHSIYFITHTKAFFPFERFHIWIQQQSPINQPAWVGIGLQCLLVVAIIVTLKLF